MARTIRRPRKEVAISMARAMVIGRSVPIDVEAIIEEMGFKLIYRPLDPGIYGMCVRRGERVAVVADKQAQGHGRLRFTLAHELGHAVLMEGDGYTVDGVGVTLRADSHGQGGTGKRLIGGPSDEVEANFFAAELLMPESEVRSWVTESGPPRMLTSDDIRDAARHFDVSVAAMTVRLAFLGIELG